MTDISALKFFTTHAHPCSYLEGQEATTIFLDPDTLPDRHLHSLLSHHGFRRSGDFLYRPHCTDCHACLPTRVEASRFQLSRRFRRILALNNDLVVRHERPACHPEFYALYSRYIENRHPGGDMYPPSTEQFQHFLLSHWTDTDFICFYKVEGEAQRLLAVAVTDCLDDGLSAVYCFFDPDEAHRSLGTYAILWQLQECQRRQLPYLYLGYLIRACRKMAYKEAFAPLQILTSLGWQRLQRR